MVADDKGVAVKIATSGYQSGEMHGLPPSGNWWTNRVFTFFRFTNGKISGVDPIPDTENIIKQIGGKIKPAAAWGYTGQKSAGICTVSYSPPFDPLATQGCD